MGVSLQLYRMTIGVFANIGRISTGWKKSINETTKKSFRVPKLMLIFLLLMSHIFTAFSTCLIMNLSCPKMSSYETSENVSSNRFVDHNFIARYTFGNKSKTGLKVAHVNIGGGYLTNKLHEIEVIIDKEKPHVIGLSEARVEKGQDLNNFY